MNDELQSRFQDRDFHNSSYPRIHHARYELQRDAVEAVRAGIQETDKQWKRRNKKYGTDEFPSGAGGAGRAGCGNRRGQGAGRRAQLRRQPAESRHGASASRDRRSSRSCTRPRLTSALDPIAAHGAHARVHRDGRADHLLVRARHRSYEPANFDDKFDGLITLRYAWRIR